MFLSFDLQVVCSRAFNLWLAAMRWLSFGLFLQRRRKGFVNLWFGEEGMGREFVIWGNLFIYFLGEDGIELRDIYCF